jgi:hypothetical protein
MPVDPLSPSPLADSNFFVATKEKSRATRLQSRVRKDYRTNKRIVVERAVVEKKQPEILKLPGLLP